MAGPRRLSFTVSYPGLRDVLLTSCRVSDAHDPAAVAADPDGAPAICDFTALWDTGATNSVITQKVVDACGLSPSGMARVNTANGSTVAETYLVNIYLPNNTVFYALRVTKAEIAGTDVLIGMDVMGQGDVAITNRGRTTFSFRMPSERAIDFVTEDEAAAVKARGGTRKDRRAAQRQARKRR